jgi:hypothetical protein
MPHREITLARVRNNLFRKGLAPVKALPKTPPAPGAGELERREGIPLAVAMAENRANTLR